MTLRQFLWGDNDLFRRLFAERAVSLDGEKEAVTRLFSSIFCSGSVLQQKSTCKRLADILVNLIYGTSNGCGHVTPGLVDYILEVSFDEKHPIPSRTSILLDFLMRPRISIRGSVRPSVMRFYFKLKNCRFFFMCVIREA